MSSPKQNAPRCDKRRAKVRSTAKSIAAEGRGRKGRSLSYPRTRATTAEDIKRSIALVDEFERDGHELRRDGSQLKCLCPFHEERTPSCSISPERGLFHCFGCGAQGSIVDYHMLKRGISVKDAIEELRERLDGVERPRSRGLVRPPRNHKAEQLTPLRLDYLERGTEDDIRRLARLRSLSVDALMLAQADGVLRFANLCRYRAWVITDGAGVVAQARRLDGGTWDHFEDSPKAWTLRGGRASWPINVLKVPNRPKAIFVEGGADLLAAYHLIWSEDRSDITPVALFGAANSIHPVTLPLFRVRRVRIYPHTNSVGIRAAKRWNDQLVSIGAVVDCYDFAGLHRGAEPVTDLNDYLQLDCDEWEKVRCEEVLP
jgi:CHC2-type zinc finger protein